MKRLFNKLLKLVVGLFLLFYAVGALVHSQRETQEVDYVNSGAKPFSVAILGASGTAGDGILKAALASNDIDKIYVITRRTTERIEQGVSAGKVVKTLHQNYLDYANVKHILEAVDAVYWAIGISSLGVDEKTYGMIHVDFPVAFVDAWKSANPNRPKAFHFISSSDISEESTTMWIREKIRAERTLFSMAEESNLRVIAYRPDYIGPTEEEAHIGQQILYWFFRPVGAAVKAREIGQAMIAVSLRPSEFENGAKPNTREIIRYSNAQQRREHPELK